MELEKEQEQLELAHLSAIEQGNRLPYYFE
jgi:hypothetical protein